MSNSPEKKLNNEDKPFWKKPEWYLEKFSPAIIVTIAAVISTASTGKLNWIWPVAIGLYFFAIGLTIVITICITNHYNKHHRIPDGCETAIATHRSEFEEVISTHCSKIDELQCKYSTKCEEAIASMVENIKLQKTNLTGVGNLVKEAERLEKMFIAAVGKRLRTNEQVAKLESEAATNSEIYIITSHFFIERYNKNMRETIVKNINKRVRYRYIIPIGTEDSFKQMVCAILAEKELDNRFKETTSNDFLTATQMPAMFFMLTIAYYELETDQLSAVVVKLPAESADEANEDDALAYLVPEGKLKGNGRNAPKYNDEHKIFLDNLREIYREGKEHHGGEIAPTKTELDDKYPKGVEISKKPKLMSEPPS